MGAPQNGWFIIKNPILRCIILGYPHGLETSMYIYIAIYHMLSYKIYNYIINQQPELCGWFETKQTAVG